MDLSDVDILELEERYNYLVKDYVDLSIELSTKLEKFGKIRKEIQLIIVEFDKRKHKVQEQKELEEKLLDAQQNLDIENKKNNIISQEDQQEIDKKKEREEIRKLLQGEVRHKK